VIAMAVSDERLVFGHGGVDPGVGRGHIDAFRRRLDPGAQSRVVGKPLLVNPNIAGASVNPSPIRTLPGYSPRVGPSPGGGFTIKPTTLPGLEGFTASPKKPRVVGSRVRRPPLATKA